MSKPTLLSPWFAVVRIRNDGTVSGDFLPAEWYRDAEDEGDQWTPYTADARLFNSIHSAFRIARAGGGYAVVIADAEALKEFRPKGV